MLWNGDCQVEGCNHENDGSGYCTAHRPPDAPTGYSTEPAASDTPPPTDPGLRKAWARTRHDTPDAETTPDVVIDGVRYLPAAAINTTPTAEALLDALIAPYMGDGWRDRFPDSPRTVYVAVTDDPEEGGEPVGEFVARLMTAARLT